MGACARYVFVEERLRSSESTFYTPDCTAIARRQSTSSLLCSSSRLAFLVEVWVRHYLGVGATYGPRGDDRQRWNSAALSRHCHARHYFLKFKFCTTHTDWFYRWFYVSGGVTATYLYRGPFAQAERVAARQRGGRRRGRRQPMRNKNRIRGGSFAKL